LKAGQPPTTVLLDAQAEMARFLGRRDKALIYGAVTEKEKK
jgi:hypothetical protein